MIDRNLDLAEFRRQRGITQAELAAFLEVNRKYVSMLETGVRHPSKKILQKLDLFDKCNPPLEPSRQLSREQIALETNQQLVAGMDELKRKVDRLEDIMLSLLAELRHYTPRPVQLASKATLKGPLE